MTWKNIFNSKRSKILILGSVVLTLVMIGLAQKRNFSGLEDSVISIYEDRLVAKDYIFEISKQINEKKISINSEDELLESSSTNSLIQHLIKNYEMTKLTQQESDLLRKLKDNIRLSEQFENQYLYNPTTQQRDLIKDHLNDQYNLIQSDLEGLSAIQLDEGKKLLENSNQILASNTKTSLLGITLLIMVVIAFVVIDPSEEVSFG